jgi:multidrug efflux system membrane fusion protein
VGHLAFVDNAVDPASGTLLLKGELANRDGALWPGEFVQVRLVLAVERDAIVVPAPAVTTGQQGTYVYVLNADSTASPRPVTVKRADEVTAVVSSGLKPGETVITDGQFRLAPGVKVLVRKAGQETRP